jgi:NADP-reducing hydrogenase subunit HndB
MKSLEELKALRDKARENMGMREDNPDATRVVVGMATCGIAAGARPVMTAFLEEVAKEKPANPALNDIIVGQTGCVGICQYEPVVEIFEQDKGKTTYIKMTPEKAVKVVHQHLIGGNIVSEYTIGTVGK